MDSAPPLLAANLPSLACGPIVWRAIAQVPTVSVPSRCSSPSLSLALLLSGGCAVAWRCRTIRRRTARAVQRDGPCVGPISSAEGCRRRWALQTAVAVGMIPGTAWAEITAGDISENIPGLMPSDLYYPDWFLGEWNGGSELVAVETPQGEDKAGPEVLSARASIGTKAALKPSVLRFISYNGKVISDRAYGTGPLLQVLRPGILNDLDNRKASQSVTWDPATPATIGLTFQQDGIYVNFDIRIALRAGVVTEGREDLFNASELYLEQAEGAQEVTPIRIVRKFKRIDGPKIQEILRIELFPQVSTQSVFRTDATDEKGADLGTPIAIYKYQVLMQRSSAFNLVK